jgi:uncharacterized membrane protein YtjA (UPF0391 family)
MVRSGAGTCVEDGRLFAEVGSRPTCVSEVTTMLGWAITFLLVALVAAVFGFGGIAGTAVEIAKLIFFVAIVLFAISAVIGLLRGRSPTI